MGIDLKAKTRANIGDFRFGNGNTAYSDYEIKFIAGIQKNKGDITGSVITGKISFLLACPTLEKSNVKQNFGTGKLSMLDLACDRGGKGLYFLDLLVYKKTEETYYLRPSDKWDYVGMDDICKIDEE